jgi:non-ribosomal peptide synthetase-like protein
MDDKSPLNGHNLPPSLNVQSCANRLAGTLRPDLLRDEVLADVFHATAQHFGHKTVYISNNETFSYADVDADTNKLAAGLIEAGVEVGDIVGLWMPRGVDLLKAQIAITKAGAAWLPFDADTPVERIIACLSDCNAKGLICNEAFRSRVQDQTTCPVWADTMLSARDESGYISPCTRGLTPDHPAYLIYTSGSTGTPKGIVITQRNICHFLRSSNDMYGLSCDDVMFQAASIAFDLSMEEIWVPYLVGASLFVATPDLIADPDKLVEIMIAHDITVLDMVPTLLGLLPKDVPSVRLILLGGEALPPSLVATWARSGRRILNTYGPTEATVVATVSEAKAGEAITIGTPLPNYTAYVCDENLQPVGVNVEGELLIGGPGVARGYYQRDDLTREKFIKNPFEENSHDPILYRSGDAVSINDEGQIIFRGRIDDQVKIRGFRVELGEIETRISWQERVAQAAVVVRNDQGMDQLVAFVVPQVNAVLDVKKMRQALKDVLPAYMIPSHFEKVEALPRLTSGKVDRKALKLLPLTAMVVSEDIEEPRTPTEAALLSAARKVFGTQGLPLEADFFLDMGGHSLLAARFVSTVRETPSLASLTLQEVYSARTLRAMAGLLDARAPKGGYVAENLSFEPPPLMRRFWCGLGQAIALPFILSLVTAQWLGVFVTYIMLSGEELSFMAQLFALLGIYALLTIVTGLISIALKWIVLGRTKPGRYPLWGFYYFRWWFAGHLQPLVHIKWLQCSPLIRVYLRLLGAKIGRDAMIAECASGAFDLVSIGDGTSIGGKVKFANAEVIGNELIIGRIHIGDDVYVGTSNVIGPDVIIEDHAELADLTAIPAGTHIRRGEIWDGSPGKCVGLVDYSKLPDHAQASPLRKSVLSVIYGLVLLVIPPISLLPIFPAFALFDQIDDQISNWLEVSYLWYLPVLTWPTSIVLILFSVGLMCALRWAILPRVSGGIYSIYSAFYMRKWIVAIATEVILETLSSLYATVYMRAWYRIMGAKIGKGAEISTNLAGRYDITAIGAKNFIADEVVLGDEDIRRGYMTLAKVQTAEEVFVGNDAVVPPGCIIPKGALIGIKSKPPANELMSEGDTWFGSPPIKLPTRQKFDGVAANWTYEPTLWRKSGRAIFEALHMSFPSMLFISCGILTVELFLYDAIKGGHWLALAGMFMAASVVIAVFMTLMCALVKWSLMGVYKPVMKPMWSWWAMRTEAVAVLYWGMGGKVLLEHLRGTPFLPWILRVFGAKFGQGVWMNSTDITEFDCVHVGDYCVINEQSALQTHLYEDRVMKVGHVTLGQGVTVGAGATVLYDTHIGDYVQLGGLTVVMKGESMPAHTRWHGAPAVPETSKLHESTSSTERKATA